MQRPLLHCLDARISIAAPSIRNVAVFPGSTGRVVAAEGENAKDTTWSRHAVLIRMPHGSTRPSAFP